MQNDFPNCIGLFWISESEEAWLKEKAGFYETPLSPVLSSGPKRLFATIKTEESARYNLIECLKVSSDGKFKILVQLKPGLNYLNFEFCRVVRHLAINCTSRYAQVEQSNKIKLVYICSSDSNGEFQVLYYISKDKFEKKINFHQLFRSRSLDQSPFRNMKIVITVPLLYQSRNDLF